MRKLPDQTTPATGTPPGVPRRAVLAGLASAVPAAAVAAGQTSMEYPMNAHAGPITGAELEDPIFAALDVYRQRADESFQSFKELEGALSALPDAAPRRPNALIHYGNRHCGSPGELKDERDRMLERGIDPNQVKAGYRKVLRRYAEMLRAGHDWDRKWDVAELRRRERLASEACRAAEMTLAATTPTTIAGVAALLDQVLAEDHYGLDASNEWGIRALENIATVLPREAVRIAA